MTYHIQVLNHISPLGLNRFDKKCYEITEQCAHPDALLVRSLKLHDMAIADSVQVIGRAGVGTNNIPIEKMTARGIPVLNTPGANANAVKELVITGMLLASRNICAALDYMRDISGDDDSLNKQVEKNKKRFAGSELPHKTLGIIGLGKIGVKVANAAIHLGMKVIGYDPAMTIQNAWELSADVVRAESMAEALQHSDFMSLHVPLNEKTRALIDANALATMKKTAVLLNFARAEIVDNDALSEALNNERLGHYVCDFPANAFKENARIIALPHLGASTQEAEENCAMMIADQVQDFLTKGYITHSVNFPSVKLPHTDGVRLAVVNANVPNMVAQISSVLSSANINIIDMINKSRDNIAYTLLDVHNDISNDTLKNICAIDGVIRARVL